MGTALVALVAGALGAGIAGLLQLRRDRVESLRQRQLDAADEFAAAASRVLLQVKLLVLDAYPKETTETNMERWLREATAVRDRFFDEVREVAGHVSRVELLFGVKSPASFAALQTIYDLGVMAKSLQPPLNEEDLRRGRLSRSPLAQWEPGRRRRARRDGHRTPKRPNAAENVAP